MTRIIVETHVWTRLRQCFRGPSTSSHNLNSTCVPRGRAESRFAFRVRLTFSISESRVVAGYRTHRLVRQGRGWRRILGVRSLAEPKAAASSPVTSLTSKGLKIKVLYISCESSEQSSIRSNGMKHFYVRSEAVKQMWESGVSHNRRPLERAHAEKPSSDA